MMIQGDGYTLYQGDCLEVLPGLGRVDAVISATIYAQENMRMFWQGMEMRTLDNP
jgi:hypothetical protein